VVLRGVAEVRLPQLPHERGDRRRGAGQLEKVDTIISGTYNKTLAILNDAIKAASG